jgi:alpha-ketoglutarate-dependent taurine dioxygenase
MTFQVKRLSPVLGAELVGFDPAAPYTPETVAALKAAFLEHHLLLIRGQEISTEDEVRLSELFGPVSKMGEHMKHGGKTMNISNAHKDGALPNGELLFHSDQIYFKHPLKAIALYAVEVPSKGGDTLFANAAMAWDNLPPRLKERVQGLVTDNVYDYGPNRGDRRVDISNLSPLTVRAEHPIAWPHPDTGRTVLLINRLMTARILGMEKAESDALLEELFAYTEDPKITYRHVWQKHDLVFWDNRVLQHARTNFDPAEKRVLRRVPIAENENAVGPVMR